MFNIGTILECLKAVLFGVVEGITEWLPISSTGHMILLEEFVPFTMVSEGFWSMFEVVIQLGAILAVVVIFWNQIWPFTLKEKDTNKKGVMSIVKMDVMTLWFKILVACFSVNTSFSKLTASSAGIKYFSGVSQSYNSSTPTPFA